MSRLLDFARKTTAGKADPVLDFADLGRRLEVTSQVLTNWKSRGISREGAEKAEEVFGCAYKWVLLGIEPVTVARAVSQSSITIASQDDSPRVKWGAMKRDDLPDVFLVEVPDDAMSDRVRKGNTIKCATDQAPRPGDGVLVSDSTGAWFFRLYSPGAQGRFAAVALNPAYQSLDSERDGLKVVAVLIGIPEARWG